MCWRSRKVQRADHEDPQVYGRLMGDVETLMAIISAFNNDDLDGLRLVHDDLTYFIRGHGPFAGTDHGVETVGDVLGRIRAATGDTMTAEPEVVVASGDDVMAYMRVHGSQPDGRTYDNHQAYRYRFVDGLLKEGQTIPVDQRAFDERPLREACRSGTSATECGALGLPAPGLGSSAATDAIGRSAPDRAPSDARQRRRRGSRGERPSCGHGSGRGGRAAVVHPGGRGGHRAHKLSHGRGSALDRSPWSGRPWAPAARIGIGALQL